MKLTHLFSVKGGIEMTPDGTACVYRECHVVWDWGPLKAGLYCHMVILNLKLATLRCIDQYHSTIESMRVDYTMPNGPGSVKILRIGEGYVSPESPAGFLGKALDQVNQAIAYYSSTDEMAIIDIQELHVVRKQLEPLVEKWES